MCDFTVGPLLLGAASSWFFVDMASEPPAETTTLLALPAPRDDGESSGGTITLDASTGEPAVMDHLGPVVVNADGTLARISNWDEMTDKEKQLTKRRIAKRNIERLQTLRDSGALTGEQMSALAGAPADDQ